MKVIRMAAGAGILALFIIFVGIPKNVQSDTITVTLSGAPSLWVTPLELDFGPVGVGSISPKLEVNITNTGDTTLTDFAGGGLSAPFSVTQNCAGGVPPGETCQYFFTFSPTSPGDFTATSSSSTNAGPISIVVHGTGVGPALHVTPLSLDFGSVIIGGSASAQTVTIRNTGLATLDGFAGGGVPAPFGASQDCAGGVAPGETCQYFFSFSPTATGIFTATSSSGTSAGSFSIELKGSGQSTRFATGQYVTPLSLDFGPVGVGTTSPTYEVTVTNQNSTTTITGFAGGGVNPPFYASQNCASGVDPNSSCKFYYRFEPTETGVFTATSNVTDSAGSFTINLRGEGAGAGLTVSPLVLDFGPVPPGSTGDAQIVSIKNTGLATLTNFAGGGVSAPFTATQNCAGGVAPGDTCEFFYYFSPTEPGRFTTTSNVSSNGGSFSITLKGGEALPVELTKAFVPPRIDLGGVSRLQLTLRNPNQGEILTDVALSDTFPPGMVVASPLNYTVSEECGTPNFTPVTGATSIALSNATLPSGKTCVVEVDVTTTHLGGFSNTAGPVLSSGGSGNTAGATLRVQPPLNFLPLLMDEK